MSRITLRMLAFMLVTLAAAGCGSAGGGHATTAQGTAPAPIKAPVLATRVKVSEGAPLPRSVWFSRADAICASANKKALAISVTSSSQFARVLPQVVLYDRTELSELSKLAPPRAMAHDWGTILNDLQTYIAYTSTVTRNAQSGNLVAAQPLISSADLLRERLDAIAAHDGLKQCSQP